MYNPKCFNYRQRLDFFSQVVNIASTPYINGHLVKAPILKQQENIELLSRISALRVFTDVNKLIMRPVTSNIGLVDGLLADTYKDEIYYEQEKKLADEFKENYDKLLDNIENLFKSSITLSRIFDGVVFATAEEYVNKRQTYASSTPVHS